MHRRADGQGVVGALQRRTSLLSQKAWWDAVLLVVPVEKSDGRRSDLIHDRI